MLPNPLTIGVHEPHFGHEAKACDACGSSSSVPQLLHEYTGSGATAAPLDHRLRAAVPALDKLHALGLVEHASAAVTAGHPISH